MKYPCAKREGITEACIWQEKHGVLCPRLQTEAFHVKFVFWSDSDRNHPILLVVHYL